MSTAISMLGQGLSSAHLAASPRELPFSTRLDILRDIVCSLISELDSLGRLAPQRTSAVNLKEAVQSFEIDLISAALARTRGNQSQAARLLGVKHTTLSAKVKRYQLR